jgi:hypothetical protein
MEVVARYFHTSEDAYLLCAKINHAKFSGAPLRNYSGDYMRITSIE